ncbi:MAG: ImmA/IrrE family metallo-endopeptidase [Burkholderiales bacterium]
MKVNGDMLILARDYRGLTQEELAQKITVAQSTIAKIEGGIKSEVDDITASAIESGLGFPKEFFSQQEELLGFGSSAYFYRKRATLPASDRKKIHSIVNLLRIAVKKILPFIEIKPTRELPQLNLDEYGDSPSQAAKAVRAFWAVPDGPIKDLTALIESSGVLVIPCDFGTRLFDATSLRFAEMPPLIFINQDVPGDRWRFTLAHELAHLILHTVPHEKMEDEANEFASEFLVPSQEVTPQFTKMMPLGLADFVKLKGYWKVSIAMLIHCAQHVGVLSESQARYQYITLSKNKMRINEPAPINRESPRNIKRMISAMTSDIGFEIDEMANLFKWTRLELEQLFPSDVSLPLKLRLVQ